jgi:hypothetical protein
MANQSSIEYAAYSGTAPQVQPDGKLQNGKVRCLQASFNLANAVQANGDVLTLGQIPAGAIIKTIKMTSSVSLATSTVAIGIAGTAAKYRAAAVFTTVDVPTPVGPGAVAEGGGRERVAETLIATVGVAALPAAGTLVFDIEYVTPTDRDGGGGRRRVHEPWPAAVSPP